MKKSKAKKHAHAMKAGRSKKQPSSLQRARAAKKELKAALIALKAEFKAKLQQAVTIAREKAQTNLHKLLQRKEIARNKMLATAAAKFEKKFVNTLLKGGKKKRSKKRKNKDVAAAMPMKRRGRPSKKK